MTVLRTGSARRNSAASARNSPASAVMNQPMTVMVSSCAGTKRRCGTNQRRWPRRARPRRPTLPSARTCTRCWPKTPPTRFFSPASVASALRMALCGARGDTAAELAHALHLDGSDRQEDVAVSGLRLVSAWRDGGLAASRQWARPGIRDVPGAEHRVGPVRPAAAARVHRPAARGRGHAGRRRFRRCARGGADLDQPRDRRADRGQDHRSLPPAPSAG